MKERAMIALYSKLSKTLGAIAVITFSVMICSSALVYAAKGDLAKSKDVKDLPVPLNITLGKAELVSLPADVSDVLVANPAVTEVQAIKSDKLYIVGLSIGDTNIIVLDSSGNVVKRIDVHVSYDIQAIQSLVERLFPDQDVKVGAVHDQILLTGVVSNPSIAAKIGSLVAHYVSDLQDTEGKSIDEILANLLEVRGEQQVMLQVKIIEAERSVIKELGVDFRANDPDELSVTTLWGGVPYSEVGRDFNSAGFGGGAGLTLSRDAIGVASGFLDSGLDGIGTLGLFLSALDEENLINVLAEPNLTAVSGQQAGFLAGGEFPVPTGRDQFGNITIEFREFGVSLNFKPIVLSDNRINLQLNTEVSSLDSSNAVVLADLTVPGLDIRRAETTIEMPSGGSLMIAGLLQSQTTEGLSGLPGIKNTPVLGDLISSDSFKRDETELVVIVTAYLVEPFADKSKSEKLPMENNNGELAKIFKSNIYRVFGVDESKEVFAKAGAYGYIFD